MFLSHFFSRIKQEKKDAKPKKTWSTEKAEADKIRKENKLKSMASPELVC